MWSALFGMVGGSSGVGVSDMRQRQAPFLYLHTSSIGDPSWSYMMTLCFVKVTLHLASQMGARRMRIGWKDGTTLPAQGKYGGRLGRPKSVAPLDWCGWPLAAPTVILGAVGSNLIVGKKYKPLAPESTIAMWSLWLRGIWAFRGGGLRSTLGEL